MERSTEDGSSSERRSASDSHHSTAGRASGFPDPDCPRDWLHRTIETEIIPRLMLAHRPPRSAGIDPATATADALEPGDIDAFTALVLRDDIDACTGFVGALRERGVPLDQVFLGLLAPTARQLGALWESDHCDFAQVTLGLWRLQSLVLDLSPQLTSMGAERPGQTRRALLAAAPGSQHTLGLLMVAEFFRRAGWEVWSDPCASEGDLMALLRGEWFDLVGLSVGTDYHLRPLSSAILALRGASRNPEIGVMVGGPVVVERPQLVTELGADFTAADARQAVERAESYVSMHRLSS